MKYFGTDGIRGRLNKSGINKKILHSLARALVKFYDKHKLNKVLLVGNDSRKSSDYILSEISTILLSYGISIDNLGVCSSPALAYTTRSFHYPLSMMISASHNPSEYNGIKFFNSLGEKIYLDSEKEIEQYMDNTRLYKRKEYASMKSVKNHINTYINYLKELKRSSLPVIIDCAYGGASDICKNIFTNNQIINSTYNGTNINHMAGCTNIEILKKKCIESHLIGFALDGDGDRLIVVSETGEIISGDKILYILSRYFLKSGDVCVGTIYSNIGLEKSLQKKNIKLIRSQVGDKNVYLNMGKNNSLLGGENSGHIIIKQYSNTGDGLLTAIVLLNILSVTSHSLNELLKDYCEYYQIYDNIESNEDFKLSNELKTIIKIYELMGIKIIIRKSGTEPVIRLMVESNNEEKSKNILKSFKFLLNLL